MDSIVSGLSMARDEARLLKFLASSGGDTASKFLPQIGERTTLDDVLILRPIVHLAAVCLQLTAVAPLAAASLRRS